MEPDELFSTVVVCFLCAGALYLTGRSKKRDAEFLKRVPRVNQLNDLSQLLDSPCTVLPLLVAISGRACSDTPITCEYSRIQGVTGTLDDGLGIMDLVVKRTEEVLPIGTQLTVVGQAVKDPRGRVQVKKSRKHPFYVSPKTIDRLIDDLETWARICKVLSIGLCAISSILLIVLLS